MFRFIAALLFTALSCSANAQADFGLVCSSSVEAVPRLLIITGSKVQYFDYGKETWDEFYSSSVDGDHISGREIYVKSFDVNRLNGTWRSQTDMNYNDSTTVSSGVCVRKDRVEMNQIAADYLAQLNNRRAF